MQVQVTDRHNKVHYLQIVPPPQGFTNGQYIGDAILNEIHRAHIPVGDPEDEYNAIPIPVIVKGKKTTVCSTCGHLGMRYNMTTNALYSMSPQPTPYRASPKRKTRTTRKSTKSKKATKRAKRNA